MISVAIPTFNRGAILVEGLRRLLALPARPSDIVVVDQTASHPAEVASQLAAWAAAGLIRHIVLSEPSIPNAMNTALREARSDRVLFLDDDSEILATTIDGHDAAYADPGVWAVVGQVLQPGEIPRHFDERVLRRGAIRDLEFRFNHDAPCLLQNAIACNLSVDREKALSIGGFDVNYLGAAHRFETDFALRIVAAGGTVRFAPAAPVKHLKLATGGLRAYGDHRTSSSPVHSVGDYYFALSHVPDWPRYAIQRMRGNVLTRYHARHPWTIPAKLLGELRGLLLARRLHRGGARLVRS